MSFKIVTRDSALAMTQTELFCQYWRETHTTDQWQILPMKSAGDKTQRCIAQLKNAFTGDLRDALLKRQADVAIHSLKDLSVVAHEQLCVAAVLERADPRDVVVSEIYHNLDEMPVGATVGTSSARRAAQLRLHYPHLQVVACRGNVLTRLKKLQRGDCDAVVLAAAGLERLGLADVICSFLSVDKFIPACAQGVICAEVHSDDEVLLQKLQCFNHAVTYEAVCLEREIVARLGAHCGMPVGVFVQPVVNGYEVRVFIGALTGSSHVQHFVFWPFSKDGYVACMDFLLKYLLEQGAQDLIDGARV